MPLLVPVYMIEGNNNSIFQCLVNTESSLSTISGTFTLYYAVFVYIEMYLFIICVVFYKVIRIYLKNTRSGFQVILFKIHFD